MTGKVRRGLGLLVVALIGWLVSQAAKGALPAAPAEIGYAAGLLVTLVCVLAGPVFIAWGLLGRQE